MTTKARALQLTPEERSARLEKIRNDRPHRMRVARYLAKKTGLDPGDLEHALFNQTISPVERLVRGLS